MNLVEIYMSIIGLILPLSATAQIFRIYKRKSGGDISLIFYAVLVFCQCAWVWYGYYINSLCIILTNGAGVLEALIIFILALYYRKS